MEVEHTNAPRIHRRSPPEIRIRSCIVLPIYFFIVSVSTFKTHQYGFTLMTTAVLGLFLLLNQGMDRGYQFAFDDERMYQRPKGWRWVFRRLPWYTIRFDDVSHVEAIHGAEASLKAKFFPFEFILIYGRTGAQGDNIVVHPPAFRDNSIKDFLHLFDKRLPSKLPEDVIEYMNSGRPL